MTLQLVEADTPAARSLGATPAGHGLRALPWTRRTNLAIALALFIVISALRLASDDPTTAISMFYLLPIALLAVEYGLRGGLLAATASAGLVATWIVVRDVDLATGELASRFALLLLLGACFGLLSDRFSRASALVDDQVLYMEGLTAHGLVRLDAAGSITGWNRGAAEILGHSSADALSQPLSLVLGHGEADTLAETVLEGALATGLWDEERWVVEKSGQRRWVAISVTPLADGGDAGFALVLRDLTARKEQELALKAKEAQLRELSQELEARVEWRTGERGLHRLLDRAPPALRGAAERHTGRPDDTAAQRHRQHRCECGRRRTALSRRVRQGAARGAGRWSHAARLCPLLS